jgi:polyphosphate kinase 2
MKGFEKPFDGEISRFFAEDFPKDLRKLVEKSDDKDILAQDYPYESRWKRDDYEGELDALQIELAKMQRWMVDTGERIVVVFEGRDAAGKGGTIKRLRENLNPRVARVVALSKPTERERGQWYFQRYVQHLPTRGEMAMFDRSWYNRAGVEAVMGFCTRSETLNFFNQVTEFETTIIEDGTRLFKIWLTVSRAEQMRRFLQRESDPLKHWKLSPIDVASLGKWDAYTEARKEMFERTHTNHAPWTVVRSDDKRRARVATIRGILNALPYDGKNESVAREPDPKISGSPALMGELT